MKAFLLITHGDGIAPESENVTLATADNEIASNSRFADEAMCLVEFAVADSIPETLLNGRYIHVGSSPADEHDGCTVETYCAVEG